MNPISANTDSGNKAIRTIDVSEVNRSYPKMSQSYHKVNVDTGNKATTENGVLEVSLFYPKVSMHSGDDTTITRDKGVHL